MPLPASPGPSLEILDEFLLFSLPAHPEFVGDDVAGVHSALGTGPMERGVVGGGRMVTSLQASPQACGEFPSLTENS